jgi:hypothetical protein
MALKSGHRLQNTYPEELANSAEKDGTIILTQKLRR